MTEPLPLSKRLGLIGTAQAGMDQVKVYLRIGNQRQPGEQLDIAEHPVVTRNCYPYLTAIVTFP